MQVHAGYQESPMDGDITLHSSISSFDNTMMGRVQCSTDMTSGRCQYHSTAQPVCANTKSVRARKLVEDKQAKTEVHVNENQHLPASWHGGFGATALSLDAATANVQMCRIKYRQPCEALPC